MKRLLLACLLLLPLPLVAQDVEKLRGGWVTEIGTVRHIYYIVLRNDSVSGTYCHDCTKPENLAFIDDGTLTESGLQFALYHYPSRGEPYVEQVEATLQGEELQLSIRSPAGIRRAQVLRRAQAEERAVLPAPDPTANTQVGRELAGRERVMPGSPQVLTPAAVAGLWLWGTGPRKQHFIFREHKGGLRGLACGPCDSVADFGPLERISLYGTTMGFDIVHEDNGQALAEHGPHSNVASAQISAHEMHLSVVPSYEGPDFRPVEMTLLGPVRD
jgi:hypothetical protein